MKKLITLSCLLFLVACATGSELISQGEVRKGMSKSQLRSALNMSYPSDDPFVGGSFSKLFSTLNKEIIYGSGKKQFYVFRNVSVPAKCGFWSCEYGNGYLENWFYSYQSAVDFIKNKKQSEAKVKEKKPLVIKKVEVSTMKQLNKLVEDYKSGKITEEEFNLGKKKILE
jgi:hypothetical protein